jgi:hypothetical protein
MPGRSYRKLSSLLLIPIPSHKNGHPSLILEWCSSNTTILTRTLISAHSSLHTLSFLFRSPSFIPTFLNPVLLLPLLPPSSVCSRTRTLTPRFNVHGTIYLGDEEHIAPVEQAIRDLSSGLQMVKDEQAYLVVRERIHRNSRSLLSSFFFSPLLSHPSSSSPPVPFSPAILPPPHLSSLLYSHPFSSSPATGLDTLLPQMS